MTGWMIMSYIIQAWASSRPQIETDIQIKTCSWVFILSATAFRWLFQWSVMSVESNQTLKTCMDPVGSIICDSLVKLIYASAAPSLWLEILVFCHLAQWLFYMNAPIKVTMMCMSWCWSSPTCGHGRKLHIACDSVSPNTWSHSR